MNKTALVIAMVMVVGMSVAAFAAPTDTTLKVNAPVDGHKYTAYQLFVGDLAKDGKTLSNVKWGSNVAASIDYYEKATADATTFTVKKTIAPTSGGAVPQAVLDYLASLDGKTADSDGVAQATANIISDWVTGTGTEVTTAGITVKTGYYVVKDEYTSTADDPRETTTLSTVICEVVGPTEITPKAGTTTHNKQVLDVNDTTDTALDLTKLQNVTSGWDKTADHDFGDKVPFKLTTTIGSDFAKYASYYLAISDTLSDGLTLDTDSIKVYVDGKLATAGNSAGQYVLTTGSSSSFKVEFSKLNGNENAAAGKDVVVYYTATLDASGTNVVIGNPGNPNTSFAEFSNNPNGNQTGKGKTPDSTAVVFTYKTDVDKIKSDGVALPNAGFTLYKKYNAAVDGKTNVAGTTPAGAQSTTFPAEEFWYEVKSIAAGTATNFEFAGIDDGTYILVESTTPDGYNTMAPITITVTAANGAGTSATGYVITSLSTDNTNFKADATGGTVTFTKKNDSTKTLTSGEIYSEIENQSGTQLPSTGGMGTTIFYIVGAILVVGAGVILITRRRMRAE